MALFESLTCGGIAFIFPIRARVVRPGTEVSDVLRYHIVNTGIRVGRPLTGFLLLLLIACAPASFAHPVQYPDSDAGDAAQSRVSSATILAVAKGDALMQELFGALTRDQKRQRRTQQKTSPCTANCAQLCSTCPRDEPKAPPVGPKPANPGQP